MSNAHSSPFKFLDSYGQEDQDIFFGREKEVDEAFDKLFQSKMLLVYGASGTGKSSIINCGVANKFQSSDWMPIHIRRGGDMVKSFYQQIAKQSVQEGGFELDKEAVHVSYHRLISSVYLDHFKPMYFIFDQFEELFIFGHQQEWEQFIGLVKYLMHTDLEIRFIFVVRGEYLEFLAEFEEDIPEFFDNRIRIEKMTRKNAEKVISGPAEVFNIQLEEGFENTLLSKVSGSSPYVELTFLQVFLDKLYHAQEAASTLKISAIERLGEMGDVLSEFVDEQLFKMNDSSAALMVLKSFVSLKGTKNRMSLEDVVTYTQQIGNPLELSIVDDIITSFVNKRILKDKDDSGFFELRHDTLAQKIYEKISYQERELLEARQFISYRYEDYVKRGTLLNDEDLSYFDYHERNLSLQREVQDFVEESRSRSDKKKRQNRQRIIAVSVIVALFITSAVGLVFSLQQRRIAEEQALLATRNAENAELSRLEAEKQRALAVNNAEEASRQAEIALTQKGIAENARSEAENQRNQAIRQRGIAERERLKATQSQKVAELNKEQADVQRDIAQQQKQNADRLRLLTTARELSLKSAYEADPIKSARMAMVSYALHRQEEGIEFQNEIFQSLYQSFHKVRSSELTKLDDPISEMNFVGDRLSILTEGNDRLVFDDYSTGSYIIEPGCAKIFETASGAVIQFLLDGKVMLNDQVIPSQNIEGIPLWGGASIIESSIILIYSNGLIQKLAIDGSLLTTNQMEEVISVDKGESIYLLHKDGIVSEIGEDLQLISAVQLEIDANPKVIHTNEDVNDIWIGFEDGKVSKYMMGATLPDLTLLGHSSLISEIRYISKQQKLITAGYDRKVIIWDLSDQPGSPIQIDDLKGWATNVALDTTQKLLCIGTSDGYIYDVYLDMNYYQDKICQLIGEPDQPQVSDWVGENFQLNIPCND